MYLLEVILVVVQLVDRLGCNLYRGALGDDSLFVIQHLSLSVQGKPIVRLGLSGHIEFLAEFLSCVHSICVEQKVLKVVGLDN
jgi:hypothetical protein